jgi:hypothetical protein
MKKSLLIVMLLVVAAFAWLRWLQASAPTEESTESARAPHSLMVQSVDPPIQSGGSAKQNEVRAIDAAPTMLPPPGSPAPLRIPEEEHMRRVGPPGLANRFDEWSRRALAGDADAARELGIDLVACGSHAGHLHRFESTTRNDRRWSSEAARQAAEEDALAYVNSDHSKALEAMCDGVTAEQIASSQQWFAVAAAAGDVASATLYHVFGAGNLADLATRPLELMQFRSNAVRFLSDAARRCYPFAFYQLSRSYETGTATERDPTRAYAYLVLAAWGDGVDPLGLPGSAERLQSLSADQFRTAVDYATSIYRQSCLR